MNSGILCLTLNFLYFILVSAQPGLDPQETTSGECYCSNPGSSSITWGPFNSLSECEGVCDSAFERGERPCFGNTENGLPFEQMCAVERRCQNENTCDGHWSEWSGIDSCSLSSNCQMTQGRFCFRNINEENRDRSVACEGANGTSHQNRLIDCYEGECRENLSNSSVSPPTTTTTTTTKTTTSRTRTTTSASSTIATSTTSASSTISSTTSSTISAILSKTTRSSLSSLITMTKENVANKFLTTTGNFEQDLNNEKHTDNGDNLSIVLPTVLCSVAFVCIAIIIVVATYVCSKHKRRGTDYPGYSSGTSSSIATHKKDNYETVGPPLPNRPKSTIDLTSAAYGENVNNLLYRSMNNFESNTFPNRGTKTESGGYLLPVELPNPANPDPVYSHIDENR